MDGTTNYTLHLGVQVTQRVLWTLITDERDEPIMNFPNVAAALQWLDAQGIAEIRWRSGPYTGTLTLRYEEDPESAIMYHVGTPDSKVQEVTHGQDNSSHSFVRSKRLSREIRRLQQVEGNPVREAARRARQPPNKRTDANP